MVPRNSSCVRHIATHRTLLPAPTDTASGTALAYSPLRETETTAVSQTRRDCDIRRTKHSPGSILINFSTVEKCTGRGQESRCTCKYETRVPIVVF